MPIGSPDDLEELVDVKLYENRIDALAQSGAAIDYAKLNQVLTIIRQGTCLTREAAQRIDRMIEEATGQNMN